METIIHEVGMRDGLQVERAVVPTDRKIRWIEALILSGVDIIQLGSFVHPGKVPQMADTDQLFAHFTQPGRKARAVTLSGLVLNEKGFERGHGLRCRAVLHGRLRKRHAQPEKHGHEHAGSNRANHRHGAQGRRSRESLCRCPSSLRSAADTKESCPRRGCWESSGAIWMLGLRDDQPGRHRRSCDSGPGGTAVLRHPRARPGGRMRLPFSRYVRPGDGQRLRCPEMRREVLRSGVRRPGRLPLHGGCRRQPLHRRLRASPPEDGPAPRHRRGQDGHGCLRGRAVAAARTSRRRASDGSDARSQGGNASCAGIARE